MNYVSQEDFDKKCKEINDNIDDIKDNHLSSIYNAQLWFNDKLEQIEKKFTKNLALGVALIAVFLAVIEVFGH